MVTVQCCGCSLRTGSMLIAIWTIITSTIVVALGGWAIDVIEDDEETRVLVIVAVTISALNLFFGMLLLVGIVKKIPALLRTWTIFECVFLVISIIGLFTLLASSASLSKKWEEVVNTALSIYFILVVHSYHKQMVDEYDSMRPVSLRAALAAVEEASPMQTKAAPMEATTYTSTSVV